MPSGKEADRQIQLKLDQIIAGVANAGGGGGGLTLPYTVTNVLRIKSDGFYLYDSDTGLYHKLTAKGAANAVYLDTDQTGQA